MIITQSRVDLLLFLRISLHEYACDFAEGAIAREILYLSSHDLLFLMPDNPIRAKDSMSSSLRMKKDFDDRNAYR